MIGHDGGDCYATQPVFPFTQHCRSRIYTWAVGGTIMTFPENVGYLIKRESSSSYEYISVEVHFDNPDVLEGVRVVSNVDIYNTPNLR